MRKLRRRKTNFLEKTKRNQGEEKQEISEFQTIENGQFLKLENVHVLPRNYLHCPEINLNISESKFLTFKIQKNSFIFF